MPFSNSLPEWNKTGTEPPQSLKDDGWAANQKPPADYFNWFFNVVYQALKELHDKGYTQDEITQLIANAATTAQNNLTAHTSRQDNPHSVTAAQTGAVPTTDVVTVATANKLLKLDNNAKLPGSIAGNADGNAATASKLQTSRSIAISGDATGSTNFDGSSDKTISLILANTGVNAGTYTKVTVDAKGRVVSATTLLASDIPNLDWSKIVSGKPTTLAGYGITDALLASAYTAADVLAKLKTVDGAGSGVDADFLDGKDSSAFYSKPINGIPKADLDSSVQGSLEKADAALQSVPPASTTQAGISKLNSATNSTDEATAATPKAIKTVNDALASHKADTKTNAHLGKNIGVEDSAGNFTGTDVESVLAELFTFANDGKTGIANAVTAKGVTASPTDTFSTLATKIGQIATGKKFASGTLTPTGAMAYLPSYFGDAGSGGGRAFLYKTPVISLDFTPSVIILFSAAENAAFVFIGNNDMAGTSSGEQNYFGIYGSPYYVDGPGNVSLSNNTAPFYVYNNNFVLGTQAQSNYTWMAFE